MASVPIKFRCYRCNQLLGVARSKAGTIVACPKCSAELLIPEPAENEPADTPTDSPASPLGALDTGVALDFLDMRPEDIRVEPGLHRQPTPSSPPVRAATVVMPPPIDRSETNATVWDDPREIVEERPRPVQATRMVNNAAPQHEPVLEPALVVPPIRFDAPTVREPSRVVQAARPRDLILPRSVVASWSLFVLLALGMAFFAGLLAGHFVWKVH